MRYQISFLTYKYMYVVKKDKSLGFRILALTKHKLVCARANPATKCCNAIIIMTNQWAVIHKNMCARENKEL